jgi:DNA-binding LytR/AlgR family response regulator
MIKYLIIDDETVGHEIIKGYGDLLPGMELTKHCYDAIEALEFLRYNEVDLIFLDLNLPKLKGFDFLRTLTTPPKVIVTTAYREFALEGYELNVVDYLLKPFSFARFLKAINKMTTVSSPVEIAGSKTNVDSGRSIFLKENKKYLQVAIDEVLYLEAYGNYTKVFTAEKTITVREKISDLLPSLNSDNFLQVHKSFAVAVPQIKSVEGNRIFLGGHEVPIGKMYKENVTRLLR